MLFNLKQCTFYHDSNFQLLFLSEQWKSMMQVRSPVSPVVSPWCIVPFVTVDGVLRWKTSTTHAAKYSHSSSKKDPLRYYFFIFQIAFVTCDLRLPLGLKYELIAFGLLPSIAFLLQGPGSHWTLKMGWICGPQMLVKNQRKAMLGNNAKLWLHSICHVLLLFHCAYVSTM
jgi:hypothetical protein